MTYPTKYTRQYDFASYQNSNPSRPLPGQQVNIDLDSAKLSISEIIDFLKGFTRADGKLANGSVGISQLDATFKLGFSLPTVWEPRVEYTTDSTVLYANKFWKSKVAHTSTDGFDESKWDLIVDFGAQADAAATSATAASVSAGNAADSESAAAGSASAASGSAVAASGSADNAAASATAANGSAGAAAASAIAASNAASTAADDAASAAQSTIDAAVATAQNAATAASADSVQTGEDKNAVLAAKDEVLTALAAATPDMPSRASAQSTYHPTTAPVFLRTAGYTSAGDGGDALYVGNGGSTGDLVVTQTDSTPKGFNIIEAELRPWQFGAKGDGDGSGNGTNDQAALQLALNTASARKRPLVFQNAIHRVNTGLVIPAGVEIDLGQGSLDFKALTNATALTFSGGGGLYGRGGAVLGPGNTTRNDNSVGLYCGGTFNSGAAPTLKIAPWVEGVEIAKFAGFGVSMAYISGGVFRNNKIHDIGYAGIGGVSCDGTRVVGNTIRNIASTGGSGDHYGVFLSRNNGTSETSDPRSKDCDISGNIVSGIDWEAIDTHGGLSFTIIGNTIRDCGRGVSLTRSEIGSTVALAPKYCTVQGNVIINTSSAKEAISVIGAMIDPYDVQDYAENITVTGNTIVGHGTDGGNVGGLYAYATVGLTVTGNTFRWCWQDGVRLSSRNYGFNISGNSYTDIRSTQTAAACIHISDAANQGYIGSETFQYLSSVSTYTANQSLLVDSTNSNSISLGKCAFVGIDGSHLRIGGSGISTCDTSDVWSASGSLAISATSGSASNSASATFLARAPADNIKVQMTLASTFYGTKIPQFRTSGQAATGFTAIAYPAAGGNWDASGTLTVDWKATL